MKIYIEAATLSVSDGAHIDMAAKQVQRITITNGAPLPVLLSALTGAVEGLTNSGRLGVPVAELVLEIDLPAAAGG